MTAAKLLYELLSRQQQANETVCKQQNKRRRKKRSRVQTTDRPTDRYTDKQAVSQSVSPTVPLFVVTVQKSLALAMTTTTMTWIYVYACCCYYYCVFYSYCCYYYCCCLHCSIRGISFGRCSHKQTKVSSIIFILLLFLCILYYCCLPNMLLFLVIFSKKVRYQNQNVEKQSNCKWLHCSSCALLSLLFMRCTLQENRTNSIQRDIEEILRWVNILLS